MSTIVLNGDTSGAITIAAPAIAGANTFTLPATTGTGALTSQLGMRNRIINGAMVIDQRNAGASVNPSSGIPTYIVDRWQAYQEITSKFTVQQNAGAVTPPVGFTNYLGFTSSSAYTVTANQLFQVSQPIEGYNIADLGWGTANAKTVTLSFQVYSSLTGTFGGSFKNNGGTRSYPFSYSIPVANTWTTINITVAGDTSGTWLTTNGIGLYVVFGLGVGSTYSGTAGSWAGTNYSSSTGATSVVGTSGATFYITGVQLEVGSSATGFEYRQYQQELALCQRYYQKSYDYSVVVGTANTITGAPASFSSGGSGLVNLTWRVSMRATPTVTTYDYQGVSGKMSGASYQSLTATQYDVGQSNATVVGTGNSGSDFHANWQAVAEL